MDLEAHVFQRSFVGGEGDPLGGQRLLTSSDEMLLELEPSSELQEVEPQLVEFDSVSHPALKLVELVLLFLEKGHLETADLSAHVEVHVSGVNQVDAALGHLLEENGPLVEQKQLARRNLVVLVQVVNAEHSLARILVGGQRLGQHPGLHLHEPSSFGLGEQPLFGPVVGPDGPLVLLLLVGVAVVDVIGDGGGVQMVLNKLEPLLILQVAILSLAEDIHKVDALHQHKKLLEVQASELQISFKFRENGVQNR